MTQIEDKYTMFMDQKNQYSGNEYTTQSNLQIHCNLYQATNGIFQRTVTNNFTICMEIQKNSNSQSNLERRMELKESTYLTSGYATKLQSLRQYGTSTRQKYRSMEENIKPRDKSTHLWTPYL